MIKSRVCVRFSLFLLTVTCATVNAGPVKERKRIESFEIPRDAQFYISSYGNEAGLPQGEETQFCEAQRPTEKEIRQQFKMAHRLAGRNLHDNYIWSSCFAEGTVVHHGKTMKWRFHLGNVIETTFPDGVAKTIGGQP